MRAKPLGRHSPLVGCLWAEYFQWPSSATLRWLEAERSALEAELKVAEGELGKTSSPFGTLRPSDIQKSQTYHMSESFRSDCDRYIKIYSKTNQLKSSLKLIQRAIDKHNYNVLVQTESADVSVAHTGAVRDSNVDQHQTMIDVGGEQKDDVVVHHNFNHSVAPDDLSMKGFLGRPVQIAALSLSLDSDIDLAFNVWSLFLGDPVVRSKLRNYAFLRCNLTIRITLSGTPFHYGRLLVAYEPFPSVNMTLSGFGLDRFNRLKYFSQAPGAKTLDVRENTPFEMAIPYVSPQPIGRLYNDSTLVLDAATPFDDFDSLGSLYISTLNQIKGVTTTVSNVFLYVYVFAHDVELLGATGSLGDVTTESDERETGPVERVSTALIPISKAMEHIPSIGYFAKASTMALSALRNISAHFGWSYPVLVDKPSRFRPDPWQNGANTIGVDTGKRITLDPKQELSIDPRIVGVDDDELAIAGICQRESLMGTFEWNPTDVPLTDLLWRVIVSPRSNAVDVVSGNYRTMPTALSFAATPFKYWRGTITYRFEIVASNFHRGKLLFVYEPNIAQYSLISSNLNINKQYTRVIDIQETQSVEFTVDWNFPKPWCMNLTDFLMVPSVGVPLDADPDFFGYANGMVIVTPFTEIQSPDGSGVEINVYVHSKSMVFNRFTDEYMPGISVVTESDENDLNRELSTMPINKANILPDKVAHDFFGEQPVSFRALLKRFMQGAKVIDTNTSTNQDTTIFFFQVQPISLVALNYLYDENNINIYNYLRKAFLAERGGWRRRLQLTTDVDTQKGCYLNVSLFGNSDSTGGGFSGVVPYIYPSANMNGTVMFSTDVNRGIEFEIPFYSNNLFLFACNTDPWYNIAPMEQSGLRDYKVALQLSDTSNKKIINETFAAGEDFTFMRWLGAYPYVLNTPVV